MTTLSFIFLAVFLAATAVHLYGSLKNDRKIRNTTKPMLLLSLLGMYLAANGAKVTTVILALFFSWLGDVLLMLHGTKYFVAGGVSFLVGHLCFILTYIRETDLTALSPVLVAVVALVFITAVVLIFRRLKEHLPKALFYPMMLYLLVNGAMNCFAVYRCVQDPCAVTVITVIGALLFFVSDAVLFFVRFNKTSSMKSHFLVMLTYCTGELLITLGLM